MWKNEKNNSKISISLLVSIGLHLLIASYLVKEKIVDNHFKVSSKSLNNKIRPIKLMEIKKISRQEIAAIKKQLQIVQTAQNHKTEKHVESRFSGESNQLVDRQTMARIVDKYQDAGHGKRNGSEIVKEFDIKKEIAKVAPKKNTNAKLSLSNLGTFNLNQVDQTADQDLALELEKKHMDSKGIETGIEGKVGFAKSNDFVEDIPLGDVTNLNTTENKYYGFYHRIRQKLEQYWGSNIHDQARKLYKAGRRMPASENMITAVTVVLSDKGQVIDIKIEGSSGVRELDQAAVESFNKAGPFPNPPKGLLVDGRAVIQWGFVVKS